MLYPMKKDLRQLSQIKENHDVNPFSIKPFMIVTNGIELNQFVSTSENSVKLPVFFETKTLIPYI